MTKKTATEARTFVEGMGLRYDPEAPALDRFDRTVPLAPEGVDPHTMPVTDIVFTPEMVAQFPDLSPRERSAASNHLFALYKSYGRNKDRNSLLHRRIGEFLASEHKRRTRPSGEAGFVQDKIRLANFLAEEGISEADLRELVEARKASQ